MTLELYYELHAVQTPLYMSWARPFRRGRLQLTRSCLRHHFHCKCFLIVIIVSIVIVIIIPSNSYWVWPWSWNPDETCSRLLWIAAQTFGQVGLTFSFHHHYHNSHWIAFNCQLDLRAGQTSTKCCFPYSVIILSKLKQMGYYWTKLGPPEEDRGLAKKQPNATSCFQQLSILTSRG